jgi:hypothetical protein
VLFLGHGKSWVARLALGEKVIFGQLLSLA